MFTSFFKDFKAKIDNVTQAKKERMTRKKEKGGNEDDTREIKTTNRGIK